MNYREKALEVLHEMRHREIPSQDIIAAALEEAEGRWQTEIMEERDQARAEVERLNRRIADNDRVMDAQAHLAAEVDKVTDEVVRLKTEIGQTNDECGVVDLCQIKPLIEALRREKRKAELTALTRKFILRTVGKRLREGES